MHEARKIRTQASSGSQPFDGLSGDVRRHFQLPASSALEAPSNLYSRIPSATSFAICFVGSAAFKSSRTARTRFVRRSISVV